MSRAAATASNPVNWALVWAAVTAIGTVLAGLALPLAFIQIGALRQDRLRAQISKVGVWIDMKWTKSEPRKLQARLLVHNASELPVEIKRVQLDIDGKPRIAFSRGTVAPGQTRKYAIGAGATSKPTLGVVGIIDAAGRLWDMHPVQGGPPQLVRPRRWWLWHRKTQAGQLIELGDEGNSR
jgi:hypothetical protein